MISKILGLSMVTIITAILFTGTFSGPAYGMPGTWTVGSPFTHPNGGIEGYAASAIGGKIYVSHGFYSATTDDDELSVYDIGTDTWDFITLTDAPTMRAELAGASALGDHYAIGGRTGGPSAINEEYDPGTDTWTTKTPMPTPRATEHSITEAGGKIYVLGGRTTGAPGSGGVLAANEEYDPSIDTWAVKTPIPSAVSDTVALEVAGKIYVVGGFSGAGFATGVGAVQIYDIATDSWVLGAPMPTARGSLIGGVCGTDLHLFGGLDATGTTLATHEIYDTVTDSWSVGPAIPTPNAEVQGVSVAGKIHVIGTGVFGNAGTSHDIWNCPEQAVGGSYLPIENTALLLAGIQSLSLWIAPVLAGGAGAAALYIKSRKR